MSLIDKFGHVWLGDKPGRNHGHPYLVHEQIIDGRAKNHVGIGSGQGAHDFGRLVHFP